MPQLLTKAGVMSGWVLGDVSREGGILVLGGKSKIGDEEDGGKRDGKEDVKGAIKCCEATEQWVVGHKHLHMPTNPKETFSQA